MNSVPCARCPWAAPPVGATMSPPGELIDSLMAADRTMMATILRAAISIGLLADYRAVIELCALLEQPSSAPFRLN